MAEKKPRKPVIKNPPQPKLPVLPVGHLIYVAPSGQHTLPIFKKAIPIYRKELENMVSWLKSRDGSMEALETSNNEVTRMLEKLLERKDKDFMS